MKPIHFYCPCCHVQLTKSPQVQMMSEISENQNSGFFFNITEEHVKCPGCGGKIDSIKMIKGEYDYLPLGFSDYLMFISLFAGGAVWYFFGIAYALFLFIPGCIIGYRKGRHTLPPL